MKKLTIIDIAKLAGVGKSTVSRVINGDLGVKANTRDKVLKVIDEVNFVPSSSAQNMRLKQNKVVGIINTRLDSRSENRVIKGILEVLYKQNYDVIILESHFSEEKTREHIKTLEEKKIAGVIVFAISDFDYDFLRVATIPVVMVAKEVEGFTSVAYNDYDAINTIINHLKKIKKENIAYIGVDQKDITTGYMRYLPYKEYCEINHKKDISRFGDFSYESGYRLAQDIFLKEDNIDSIVCATDNIALGVRKYLFENNISDIIVTGVGNDKLLRFLYEDHISINFKYEDVGKKVGRSILKKIAKDKCNSSKIKGELVVSN